MQRMNKPWIAGAAGLAVALLAGCVQTPSYPSATPSVTTPTAAAASTTSTPSPTPSPAGDEAKITAQIEAYSDFINRVYLDPNVAVNEAAKYLIDVEPDNVMSAVSRQIVQFRADGYKETGKGTITVTSIKSTTGGSYLARTCSDDSQIVVTNAKGQKVDTGPAHGAGEYLMSKGVDGIWRIAKIQGTGTC